MTNEYKLFVLGEVLYYLDMLDDICKDNSFAPDEYVPGREVQRDIIEMMEELRRASA